jgi:hypothetical protein
MNDIETIKKYIKNYNSLRNPLSKFDRILIVWLSTPSNELKAIVKHILDEK